MNKPEQPFFYLCDHIYTSCQVKQNL